MRDVDLAAGLLLEAGDPVRVRVVAAVLDVVRPGDDVDRRPRLAELGQRALGHRLPARRPRAGDQPRAPARRWRRERAPLRTILDPCASSSMLPRAARMGSRGCRRRRASATRRRACMRSQTSRTALPLSASASIEDVATFCLMTASSPPASSVTWYLVSEPRYTTSRTCPSTADASPPGTGAPGSRDGSSRDAR